MTKLSNRTESNEQAIKRLGRLEIIESLLDFSFASQSQDADEIAEERQRLTLQVRRGNRSR